METKRFWYYSAAAVILVIAAVSAFFLFRSKLFVGTPQEEARYEALERHRAAQREASPTPAETTSEPVVSNANANAAATHPATNRATAQASALPSWTDFRGPARDGRYDSVTIKTDWPTSGLDPLWKQPVGGGYASFVVADGMAYTIEQRRDQEVVACYLVDSGREVWTNHWSAEYRDSTGNGPRATPTLNEGRLYALGAMGDMRCLDAKGGKVIWSKNILSDNDAKNLQWGTSAAPLVVDDKVIVQPGGVSGKSVVAYNKLNGRTLWRVLDDQAAYTSPMLVTLAGKRQLLVVTERRVAGLNIDNGELLWDYPWSTSYGVNSAQPIIVGDNRFFISAGYDHGAAVVEVAPSESAFQARTVWSNRSMKNKFNSSVLLDGYIYGLDDGILACVDVQTGEKKWKGGRYGYGQLLLVGGYLIVVSDTGELALVKPTPAQHTEMARFQAIEGKTWNNPAIAGTRLLVRNETEMACFDIGVK
ncbi:MAG TPA: PQQ-binding-like beta-propeller repeat protein [Blastocatellia bacterium]|nr:PQQ-binding-like beta-propeller repeat protein [Blastocatellia bacterium]